MKKLLIYLFFFLVFLLSFIVSGVVDSQDGLQYLGVARNIFYGKGPTSPPYEYDVRKNIHMPTSIGRDGKQYAFTGLGFSTAMVPAVAITNSIYKHYNVSPPTHFPLESDWLILLTASFTNIFFTALLGTVLFLYFLELKLNQKQSLTMTFLSIFTTNLLTYSKHIMPHMMFLTFMFSSFYLLKLYSRIHKKWLLLLSGIAFGISAITYNQTFVLGVIPYILYYLLLTKPAFQFKYVKKILMDFITFVFGIIPFAAIYYWFENLRASTAVNYNSPATVSRVASYIAGSITLPIFFEGIFGQLFSPGRSIFIYSPLLLIIPIFWFKIRKRILPETVLFVSYSLILISFYASVVSTGAPGEGVVGLWPGESSWGPRYMTPLIPLGMLLVGNIFSLISKRARLIVFLPLSIIGLYIELLGVLMPYQIKFHDLEAGFHINSTAYNVYTYSNLLPRYSPIITMSKKLIKLYHSFPLSFDYGAYNLRFFDGISFPFNVGPERWRAIEKNGYISFDNNSGTEINKFSFDLINHPLSDTKSNARLSFLLNGNNLLSTPIVLKITERKTIDVPINKALLKPKNNILVINVDYGGLPIFEKNKQILGLISIYVNDVVQNKESIYIPSVSPLGPAILGVSYRNWGGSNRDPWLVWDLHTQTFERLPDFWWIRNIFYWDVPNKWIKSLFIFNLAGLAITASGLYFSFVKLNAKKRNSN